jgi:hypothetical protein
MGAPGTSCKAVLDVRATRFAVKQQLELQLPPTRGTFPSGKGASFPMPDLRCGFLTPVPCSARPSSEALAPLECGRRCSPDNEMNWA